FFQAEDCIRDRNVTGVQTCALPISDPSPSPTSEPDPSPITSPTSDPEPEFSCAVAATAEDPWLFGFDAVVTLTNTSERTLLGWRDRKSVVEGTSGGLGASGVE